MGLASIFDITGSIVPKAHPHCFFCEEKHFFLRLSGLLDFQLNRQLGGSMPNCVDGSGLSSRRSSRAASAASGGLACLNSYAPLPNGPIPGSLPGSVAGSRRSSAGSRPGSRRESFFLNPQDSLDSNNGSSYINASSLAASAALPPGTGNEQEMTAGQTLLQSIGAGVVGAASNFSTITPPRYRKSFLRPYQHL